MKTYKPLHTNKIESAKNLLRMKNQSPEIEKSFCSD